MNRLVRVQELIQGGLHPEVLEIQDESHQHGHGGVMTHIRLVIVSPQFEGLSRVARQQKVYALLKSEFDSGLHALAMRTLTPHEWAQEGQQDRFESPPCAKK